jgi:hypothetical protein
VTGPLPPAASRTATVPFSTNTSLKSFGTVNASWSGRMSTSPRRRREERDRRAVRRLELEHRALVGLRGPVRALGPAIDEPEQEAVLAAVRHRHAARMTLASNV